MGLRIGPWEGPYLEVSTPVVWPRFYTLDGRLVLTAAEAERARAEMAEAELARLRAVLAERQSERPPGA